MSPQKVLRPGVVIADKYRIDRAVARGGFSVIYRGTHIDMQRPVGLKLLTLDDDIRPSWLERFTREARLASQLTNPHTVTIFDYGQDPRGFLYIVMEWVEGDSLYQHLKQRGPLSPPAVARIASQVLESLQEAHQRRFLHRDLKPSNIMLTRDYQGNDTVKVLDFGIAKDLREKPESSARITHRGAFVGTPRYASPEQLEDTAELGPPSDIYSLGLLMWEALVGDPAVPSTQYGDCVQHHTGPEPWLLPVAVQCPPGLERILYKALAKPVAARYPGCAPMLRDLQAWLGSREARDEEGASLFAASPPPAADSTRSDDAILARLAESRPRPSPPPLVPEEPTRAEELAGQIDRLAEGATPSRAPHPAAGPTSHARPLTPQEPKPSTPGAPLGPPADRPPRLLLGLAALGLVLAAAVGWYAWPTPQPPQSPTAATSPADAAAPAAAPEDPNEDPDEDNTPSYSAALLWTALQESGWKKIGRTGRLEFDGVTQENARYRKKGKTIAVTIFLTPSADEARAYTEIAQAPTRAIRFGRNVVQIGPGSGDSGAGIDEAMEVLARLKQLAGHPAEH